MGFRAWRCSGRRLSARWVPNVGQVLADVLLHEAVDVRVDLNTSGDGRGCSAAAVGKAGAMHMMMVMMAMVAVVVMVMAVRTLVVVMEVTEIK